MTKYHKNIIIIVSLVALLLTSVANGHENINHVGSQKDKKIIKGKVQLFASIQKDDEGEYLLIEMFNGSNKTIFLDKELVIYIGLDFKIGDKKYEFEDTPIKLPKDLDQYWKNRIIRLPPGDSVSRKIRFNKKTKCFSTAKALGKDGRERYQGYEDYFKVPVRKKVNTIEINYSDTGFQRGAAYTYIGVKNAEKLYSNSHKIIIKVN